VRGLALLGVAGVAIAAVVGLTREPEEAWAVAVVIVALGLAAGAFATLVQLRAARTGRGRASGARRGQAMRRGVEIGAVVVLILWLRAVDGLSVITASFVIATFIVTEAVLSAPSASSR
jgi:hypothetical protein